MCLLICLFSFVYVCTYVGRRVCMYVYVYVSIDVCMYALSIHTTFVVRIHFYSFLLYKGIYMQAYADRHIPACQHACLYTQAPARTHTHTPAPAPAPAPTPTPTPTYLLALASHIPIAYGPQLLLRPGFTGCAWGLRLG